MFRFLQLPIIATVSLFAAAAFAQITFDDWRNVVFNPTELSTPTISGALVDPDTDGASNLQEFVFAGAPFTPEAHILPSVAVVADHLTLTFRERHDITGVDLRLQGSSTLTHWITFNAVTEADREPFTGFDEVTLIDPAPFSATSRRFLRLRISLADPEILRAPEQVNISVQSPNVWTIGWTDPNIVDTGHAIERLRGLYTWEQVGTTGPDQSAWTHTIASYAESFTYRVVAKNAAEQEAASPPYSLPDTDGDGIPDVFELGASYSGVSGTYASYPDQFSSNGSGVSDGWLVANGFDLLASFDGSLDSDGDGVSDYDEYMKGTNPQSEDTDGDGVLDSEDGWPRHAWITAAPLPETNYAIIPLRDLGWPVTAHLISGGLDDRNVVHGVDNDAPSYLGDYVSLDPATQAITRLTQDELRVVELLEPEFGSIGDIIYNGVSDSGHVAYSYSYQRFNPFTQWSWNAGVISSDGTVSLIPLPSPQTGATETSGWPLGQGADGSVAMLEFSLNAGYPSDVRISLRSNTGVRTELSNFTGSAASPSVGVFSNSIDSGHLLPSAININGTMVGRWTSRGDAVGGYAYFENETFGMIYGDGNVLQKDEEMSWRRITDGTTTGFPVVALGVKTTTAEYYLAHEEEATLGTWTKELMRIWNQSERRETALTNIFSINNRMEFLAQSGTLVRNGRTYNLSDLVVAGWSLELTKGLNNHGVILADAKRTVNSSGEPIPVAQQVSEPVLLVPYYLAQAEGENAGRRLVSGAPVYEPNDGVGKGEPILYSPETNVSVDFSTPLSSSVVDTISCSLWGVSFTLLETGLNTLIFEDATADVTIGLTEAPLLDSGVQERMLVTITSLPHQLDAASYSLLETSASSGSYEDGLVSAVVKVEQLSSNVSDVIELTLANDIRSGSWALQETGNATGVFTDGTITAQLATGEGLAFQIGAADVFVRVTSQAFELSGTKLRLLHETSDPVFYRNQAPATPTDAPASTLPDFAKWKLKIGIPPALVQSLGLRLQTSDSVELPAFDTQPDANGFYQTASSYALVPHTITEAVVDGALALKVKTDTVDWRSAVGGLKLVVGAIESNFVAATEKITLQAIVLQSIDLGPGSRITFGINTAGRIAEPLEELGYTVYIDKKATTPQTLSEYAKGKQIWYSLSHGTTQDGSPYTNFGGINFYDSKKEGTITAARLVPLQLNYTLVIVDGCASAQTNKSSPAEAIQSNTLTGSAAAFANAFGPNVAYLGWGWETNPASQKLTGKFVTRLKGKRTVGSAHDAYLSAETEEYPGAPLLKLYGKRENKVDLNVK